MISPRYKQWCKQGGRFLVIGALAAAIDIAIFTLCITLFHWHYLLSSMISFIIAVISKTLIQKRIFRYTRSLRSALQRQFAISLLGLAASLGAMIALVDGAGAPPLLARVITIASLFILNIALTKRFIL